ncbi:hypothetical protein Tco_0947485 [Tanacetum coccineum]
MADLEFVDQHNMVVCLEKIARNSEFHEIVDFLTSSLIHHALTISLIIYISYIEQFWNTASSQTVNDEKQIHATVNSKAVVVTEASIRSSLLLNDADGTACLTNEAIFQNLALMGYDGELIEDGEGSKQPTEPQPTPSPTQPSVGDQPHVTESSSGPDNTHSPSINLEGTGGNKGDQVQLSNDSPHSGGNTSERAEGCLNLEELLPLLQLTCQNRDYKYTEEALLREDKERIVDFVPIGSEKDERLIQKMNKKVADVHEEKVLEEPTD